MSVIELIAFGVSAWVGGSVLLLLAVLLFSRLMPDDAYDAYDANDDLDGGEA